MGTEIGHRHRTTLRAPAGLLVAACSIVVLVGACGGGADGGADADRTDGAPATDRGLLEDITEVHYDTVDDLPDAAALADTYAVAWPASARDIDLAQGGFQDPYYLARLRIDAADLDELLEPALCRELTPTDAGGFPTSFSEPAWWTPQDATSGCQGDGPSVIQGVAVDGSAEGELIVYLAVAYT